MYFDHKKKLSLIKDNFESCIIHIYYFDGLLLFLILIPLDIILKHLIIYVIF